MMEFCVIESYERLCYECSRMSSLAVCDIHCVRQNTIMVMSLLDGMTSSVESTCQRQPSVDSYFMMSNGPYRGVGSFLTYRRAALKHGCQRFGCAAR